MVTYAAARAARAPTLWRFVPLPNLYRRLAPLLFVGALVWSCKGPTPPRFSTLAEGLSYAEMPVTSQTRAHVFRAELARWRPVILEARREDRTVATVRELAEEAGVPLAVNGSFFDEHDRPLGLLVSDGKEQNPLRKSADWGVLFSRGEEAALLHTKEMPDSAGLEFAVQCGPRVLIKGEVPKLKPQFAARTALGLAPGGTLFLLVTEGDPAGADALGAFFRDQLKASDAMLLDGGPSTQLYAKLPDFSLERPGGSPVANAVALRRR